ncbi:hypothetical protein HRS9139_09577 [Pyrenophora teres f. teres]|nr:hypothetical protein HRS9139_09577 [Pyrenophora teres f. teres]
MQIEIVVRHGNSHNERSIRFLSQDLLRQACLQCQLVHHAVKPPTDELRNQINCNCHPDRDLCTADRQKVIDKFGPSSDLHRSYGFVDVDSRTSFTARLCLQKWTHHSTTCSSTSLLTGTVSNSEFTK